MKSLKRTIKKTIQRKIMSKEMKYRNIKAWFEKVDEKERNNNSKNPIKLNK